MFDPDHGYRNLGENIREIVREMERVYQLKKVLLLHDCKSTSTSSLTFCDEIGTYQGFSIVLASSPDEDNYKEFVKVEGLARRFYYPPWTFDELKAVKPKLTQAGFDLIGGIPRHYDEEGQPSEEAVEAIRTAIETFNYDQHEPGGIPTIGGESTKLTSKIVLWEPTDDYKRKTVKFVSIHAGTLWLDMYKVKALEKFLKTVTILLGTSALRTGLAGIVFEKFALDRLRESAGYLLETTVLPKKGDGRKEPVPHRISMITTNATPVERRELRDINSITSNPPGAITLFIPVVKNFACFDAFLVVGTYLYLVQVTIAGNHDFKAKVGGILSSLQTNWGPNLDNVSVLVVTDDENENNIKFRLGVKADVVLSTAEEALLASVKQYRWVTHPAYQTVELPTTTKQRVWLFVPPLLADEVSPYICGKVKTLMDDMKAPMPVAGKFIRDINNIWTFKS